MYCSQCTFSCQSWCCPSFTNWVNRHLLYIRVLIKQENFVTLNLSPWRLWWEEIKLAQELAEGLLSFVDMIDEFRRSNSRKILNGKLFGARLKIQILNTMWSVFAINRIPFPKLLISSDSCDQILLDDPIANITIAGDINKLNIQELMHHYCLHQIVKASTRETGYLTFFWLLRKGKVHKGLVSSSHLVVTVAPSVPVKTVRKHVSFRDTRDHCKLAVEAKSSALDLNEAVPATLIILKTVLRYWTQNFSYD